MGKSTVRGRGRGRGADIVGVFGRPKQSLLVQILGLVVRARAELFVLAVLITAYVAMRSLWDMTTTVVVSLIVVAVVFALPWSRRFIVARCWCVVDRHRLRACLKRSKIRTMNLEGELPFMVWARPTRTGERVWLWIRAGSSADDIEGALAYIAPACYARDARLHRVRSLSTVVAVDIIRRDPLSKPRPVISPLSRLSTRVGDAGEGTEPITAVPVTEITSTGADAVVVPEPRGKTRKATASSVEPIVPAVMVGGEDVSDYVD